MLAGERTMEGLRGYHSTYQAPMHQDCSCSAWTSFGQYFVECCRADPAHADGVEAPDAAEAEGGGLWDPGSWLRVSTSYQLSLLFRER